MDALVDNPRIPLNEICKKTGLTPKIVRKHMEKLIDEEVVYLIPRLDACLTRGTLSSTFQLEERQALLI